MRLHGLFSRFTLRLLGAGQVRHRVGPVTLATHRLGPPGGEPWVLLHGMGSTALGWYPALRALRADCRLLAPELADMGGTRAPHRGLNVREGVAAVADLIAARCGGRPVVLAGISLGGWIATRIALERPELVKALLLVACAGYRNQDWYRIRALLEIERLDDVDPLMDALFQATPVPVRWARRAFRSTYRSHAVRHVLQTISVEDSFGPAELAGLRLPVGLIWGELDGIFPLEVARAMQADLPQAWLQVIPGCAHVVPWDRPGAFLDRLRAYRAWLASRSV